MTQSLQAGTLLQGGKYRILDASLYVHNCDNIFLGQGGFGITYLAEQELLGIKVAIKEFFMKDFCNRDETTSQVTIGTEGSQEQVAKFREKFLKEARNIAKLHHPNIVRISDVFEENGTAYYVMDYCEGGSLSELLKLHPLGIGEPLALKYIRQVASALEQIHAQKMNHLDVKPANILLDAQGNAVLIDFGLSKQYDDTGSQVSTTPVGVSYGYAPTEQYTPGGVSEFSPATDIYSLGATLYKLITGQTPPEAQMLLEEELPAFATTPSVSNAIRKAMQVRRSDRPQTIAEWVNMLDVNIRTTSNVSTGNSSSQTINNSNQSDDEATLVAPKSGWQEEEEARQLDFQEKMKRAQEEAARKAAEEARKQTETEARRKAEEEARKKEELRQYEEERKRQAEARRREDEDQRKDQEEASKKAYGHVKTIIWIVVVLVVLAVVLMNMSSGSSSNYSSQSNTSQRNNDTNVTREAMYYEGGVFAYYWTGKLKNGYPEGYGTADYPENDTDKRYQYKGYMKHGLREGSDGELTYRNGNSYKGGFGNDDFVYGKLTLKSDGVYYNGTFKDNRPHNGSWYNISNNKEISKVVNGVESDTSKTTKTTKATNTSNTGKQEYVPYKSKYEGKERYKSKHYEATY